MASDVRALPDGLVLRTIRPDDIDQTAELLVQRGEPADGEDLRLVLDDPDAGRAGTAWPPARSSSWPLRSTTRDGASPGH